MKTLARLEAAFARVVAGGQSAAPEALDWECVQDPEIAERLRAIVAMHRWDPPRRPKEATPGPESRTHVGTVLFDRYELQTVIGSGTFGQVFTAWDRRAGLQLAVKVLHSAASTARLYFKNEFRVLKQIHHPHIVRLFDGFFDDEPWMFTMEFVPGRSFLEGLDTVPADERERLVRMRLLGLAEGLGHLHARGLQHRDLKPANILVHPDGRVVLLDFGLVRNIGDDASQVATFAGTLPYMAPEQLAGGQATSASDWFAVGSVLYQALTGELPFPDGAWSLRYGANDSLRSPKELRPDVATDLSDLCMALLQRAPAARASYGRVIAAASVGEAPPREVTMEEPFFGRTRELDLIIDAFCRSVEHPTVVHLCGPSGIGKTALVRRALSAIKEAHPDVLLLLGQCHPHEVVPYRSLDELVDQIGNLLKRLPLGSVEQLLPRNFAALARMFPVLGAFQLRRSDPPAKEPTELRARGFAALGELLGRLAERRPLVIGVDDLQWGDQEGGAFLDQLMDALDAPRALLLLAYRAEDVEVGSWLSRLRHPSPQQARAERRLIDLAPLETNDVERLVDAVSTDGPPVPETLRSEIVLQAAGDPYVAREMILWARSRAPEDEHILSSELVFRDGVAKLPADSRTLLELIAVCGQPTPLAALQRARPFENVLAARDELLRRKLIRLRTIRGREEFDVYHDRVRVGVLQSLEEGAQIRLHADLARAFQATVPVEPARLAFHLEQSHQHELSAVYARQAADQSFDVLDFERAARFFAQALSSATLSAAERGQLLRKQGDALSNIGRGPEAARAYSDAAQMISRSERIELTAKAAAQLIQSGRVEDGMRVLNGVMGELRVRPPASRPLQLAQILRARARLRLRGLSSFHKQGKTDELSEQDRLRLEVAWVGTMGTTFTDPIRSMASSNTFVALARRSGSPGHMALALTREAILLSSISVSRTDHNRADDLLSAATRLAERCRDPQVQGRCLVSQAGVAFLQGRWRAACHAADSAIDFLRSQCVNVAWENAMAHILAFQTRFIQGDWSTNRVRLPGLLRDGEARGDLNATVALRVMGCAYQLELAADDPRQASAQLSEDMARWGPSHVGFLMSRDIMARMEIALYTGDAAKACQIVANEWRGLERSYLLRNGTTFSFLYFARARAELMMAAQAGAKRRVHLGDALKSAKRLESRGAWWSQGLALLIRAGAAAVEANSGDATRHLRAALVAFQAADMPLFQILTQKHLLELNGTTLGDDPMHEWADRQGVVRADRVLAALSPGFAT